ncbi:MAG: hypothetical protein M3384_18085 [Acidobacteriota bacterium]|nr:hypothetical protein [Acidobacteriota bacterium]
MTKHPMVQRTIVLFACLMTAAFAVLFSATTANAQASSITSNYTETIYPLMYSGCAGRVNLTVQGEIHFVFHVTETPSGQRIFKYHINYAGVSAVDPAGNQYSVSSGSNDTTVLEDSDQRNFTVVQYFKLIGQGQAANERVKTTSHITINDNGEITSIFSRFDGDCSTRDD